uniref:Uncharacterized protein n=1 Tax=Ascaris lumbricoides TaxID=6252 RepID=A0A0M3HIH8_ASCLU
MGDINGSLVCRARLFTATSSFDVRETAHKPTRVLPALKSLEGNRPREYIKPSTHVACELLEPRTSPLALQSNKIG